MGTPLPLPRLRPDQWAIVAHPAKVKILAMGRRYGKSTLAGAICLAAANAGGKAAWVVPTYKNSRPVWRWAEHVCGPLEREKAVRINRTERFIEFPRSRGFFGVYSADNDTAIRGDWFNVVVVDEAARVAEQTWTEVIQPTLADADGDAILPSTPMGRNWFWREWQRGIAAMDGQQAAWTAPSTANPMPTIQRAAALAKERVPDSTYRQEWLAEFVEGASVIFSRDWFTAPLGRYDAADPRHAHGCLGRWVSWDTAFTDTDQAAYSACVVVELTPDYRLLVREVWRDKLTFPRLVERITAMAERHNHDGKLRGVVIEDKGTGISATQTLTEATEGWLARLVVPFAPQGSKRQRAELAAVWCQQGCVALPHPSPQVSRWLLPFEGELFTFPDAPYLDQVDAFSQIVLYLSHYLTTGRQARQQAATQQDRHAEHAELAALEAAGLAA